ncbi:MAG: hypothetical protein QY318_02575 [Candidatus Dojkabacteria bacterium]|nr:MAG: hypothetical protein QY318_02575 [Candidatus Dojkabacteria bacterium]
MDYVGQLNQTGVEVLSLNFAFQCLFFVLIVGYLFYAFMLTVRVRILSETIKAPYNNLAVTISYIHLLVALIGGFLALLVILLA